MPWRRWWIRALWQLYFRDYRSRFSNGLCHGRDCQHQGEADVVLHNLLLCCPTISFFSFLAFLSDGCHVCAREVTCRISLAVHPNNMTKIWQAACPHHFNGVLVECQVFYHVCVTPMVHSLLEHPRWFFSLLPSRKPGVNVYSPLSRSKSRHCTAVWTELIYIYKLRVRYTRTFVSLITNVLGFPNSF